MALMLLNHSRNTLRQVADAELRESREGDNRRSDFDNARTVRGSIRAVA